VAIVEQLNDAGVDVRMFLSRAAMWRALHEDASKHTHERHENTVERGTTTAISVASITPQFNLLDTISHTLERIVGDCEVSLQRNRYPQLVISDGDMPGMLRAKFGGIPSVGIAHGQLFNIAVKPDFISKSRKLSKGWDKQSRLNSVASFFSEWQIATHFCFLESRIASGVVARAPLRPEVVNMAAARRDANHGTVPEIPYRQKIEDHLLDHIPSSNVTAKGEAVTLRPPKHWRKVVICYFRDRNGDVVVEALLEAGFDVLLFDNGYMKGVNNDPNRYGAQWVVTADEREAKWKDLQREKSFGNSNRKAQRRLRQTRRRLTEEPTTDHKTEHETIIRRILNSDEDDDKPRLIRVTDRSLFTPLMHVADGVASSAGSQLMSECIYSAMPLLALYLEEDDEQRLNVELSRHCRNPQVFGTSFQNFQTTIPAILRRAAKDDKPIKSKMKAWRELDNFMKAVKRSKTSEAFYDQYTGSPTTVGSPGLHQNTSEVEDHDLYDKDAFVGLPDAAEIILEILKKV
jgi:hypothetical protein